MSVATNTWHHIRVNLQGSAITVFVDNLAAPLITRTDTNFNRGQIGVRAFQCDATFDNVTFSNAVRMHLYLQGRGSQLDCSWPDTSVSVKLCALTNLMALDSAETLTNQPVLTNGFWHMPLEPAYPAQFFLLLAR
jgi:hypothetical protein